jgi:hypothetical protein
MFQNDIGHNLSALLVRQLRKDGVETKVVDIRLLKPIRIKIGDVLMYVKYANRNRAGNWYFGFYPADITDEYFCNYAIVLCGEGKFIRVYLLPFSIFSSFVRKGSLVPSNRRSEQYQAHIFPKRGFIMKMTGNADSELQMDQFQLHHGEIDSTFIELLLHNVGCR